MSMKSSYFTRSQKLTYAIDAVKNAMVTMIQTASCMSDLLGRILFHIPYKSDRHSIISSCCKFNFCMFGIHSDKFSSRSRRIELRHIENLSPGCEAQPFPHKSHQDAQ